MTAGFSGRPILRGDLARFGEYDRAIRLMEFLQHSDFGGPTWPEREMGHRDLLANLYLQVGRDDDAVPLLAGMAEYLEAEYESGIRHPTTLAILAEYLRASETRRRGARDAAQGRRLWL